MDIVDLEDLVWVLYCGPKNMKPLTTYTPFIGLNVGNFVFVKPYDPNIVLIWMGKIEGDVIKDEESEYFKMVKVQWWVPRWRNDQLWMNDICMKIVEMASGNVV